MFLGTTFPPGPRRFRNIALPGGNGLRSIVKLGMCQSQSIKGIEVSWMRFENFFKDILCVFRTAEAQITVGQIGHGRAVIRIEFEAALKRQGSLRHGGIVH